MNSGFQSFQQQQQQQWQRGQQQAWWQRKQREKQQQQLARKRQAEQQRRAAASTTKRRRGDSLPPPRTFTAPARAVPERVPPITLERGRWRRIGRMTLVVVLTVVAIGLAMARAWQVSAVFLLVAGFLSTRRREDTEAGVASSVEVRFGERKQTLAFRLERWDQHGERMTPIAVTATGSELEGQLRDGDRVEVIGRPSGRGALKATTVRCLDTGETVRMKQKGRIARAFSVLVTVVITAIWVILFIAIITAIGNSG